MKHEEKRDVLRTIIFVIRGTIIGFILAPLLMAAVVGIIFVLIDISGVRDMLGKGEYLIYGAGIIVGCLWILRSKWWKEGGDGKDKKDI